MLECLLDNGGGAHLDVRNQAGQSALSLAAALGRLDVVRVIVSIIFFW